MVSVVFIRKIRKSAEASMVTSTSTTTAHYSKTARESSSAPCGQNIAMLAPGDVHSGRAERILEQRQRTLQEAWSRNPERFVHGPPKPQTLPNKVWINPPDEKETPQVLTKS